MDIINLHKAIVVANESGKQNLDIWAKQQPLEPPQILKRRKVDEQDWRPNE